MIAHLCKQNCTRKTKLKSRCKWISFSKFPNLSKWLETIRRSYLHVVKYFKHSFGDYWVSLCKVIVILHLCKQNWTRRPELKFHCNWNLFAYFPYLSKLLETMQTSYWAFVRIVKACMGFVRSVQESWLRCTLSCTELHTMGQMCCNWSWFYYTPPQISE